MRLLCDANTRARTAGPPGPAVRLWRRRARRLLAFASIGMVCACSSDRGTDADARLGDVPRVRVRPREIPLAFDVDPDLLEFSALAWWGDRLLMVPQDPRVAHSSGEPHWYVLERAVLARWLDGSDPGPLRPESMSFDDDGIQERIAGWDGYEAVALRGDSLVASIERVDSGKWGSVIVRGMLRRDPLRVQLDASVLIDVEGHSGRPNFSEEALVATEDAVYALHELNGRRVNPRARAHRMGWDLTTLTEVPMAALEYRITDATDADQRGRFWVTNQFWPPEAARVRPASDPLAVRRRPAGEPVERLVALLVDSTGVHLDRSEGVIELELSEDRVTRNWEGIVRWEDEGFLIVTDRYPRTILAFVPRR
jgi:hypothetical protein